MNRARRFICSFAVLLFLGSVFGLRSAPAGDDWLPILPEDLALKENPANPGSDAMILYRESTIRTSDSSADEYVRIKIFTQAGVKYGDVQIDYQKGLAELQNVRARTIRPNGEVINWDGKAFDSTVLKYRDFEMMAKKFTLPGLEPGCIVEYKYREHFEPRYVNLTWTVQEAIFTRLARFSIKPPARSPVPLFFRHFNLPAGALPQRQADGSYTLEIHDLPGIAEEANMPPETALRARVDFFYQDSLQPVNKDTDQFWAWFGALWSTAGDQFLDKQKLLTAEVARATSPSDAPEAKLRKLFARTLTVRNLSLEATKTKKEEETENLKTNNNVEDLIKHGYGTGRQINLFLVGLARAAGFQSTMVYVAPRSRYFFEPQLQDTGQVTSDIVWVKAGAAEYYVDPSQRFYPFGTLPWYETQASGVRVSKTGVEFVTTPLPPSSDAILERSANLQVDEEGTVSGTIEVEFKGQQAALWRDDERSEDEAGRKKKVEEEIKSWLPAGSAFELTKMSNWSNVDEPLTVEGTIKVSGFATTAGRRLLMPATLFQAPQTKDFVSAKRVNMVYFKFPYEEVDDVKVRTPSGYKIETTPSTRQVGGGPVFYQISASAQGDAVDVRRHLVVKGISFPAESYPGLRTFFNTAKSNDDSQVVFQSSETAKNN